MSMSSSQKKLKKLPQTPGVYIFRGKSGEILYVGKAANLRERVKSYFLPSPQPSPGERGGYLRPIEAMIHQVADIETRQTDSVLEALILEAHLIKKYQPKYNAMGKDDKSFAYFVITREEFPRIIILRKTELEKFPISLPRRQAGNFPACQGLALAGRQFPNKSQIPKSKISNVKKRITYTKIYGPYTSKKQMEIALKIIRKIFPFHSVAQKSEKGCLDFQIGTCPGPYVGAISREDYLKNIRGIKMILEGKKKSLVKTLEKEMLEYSKKHEYEKAAELRNKIFALKHIRDVALISAEAPHSQSLFLNKEREEMEKNFRIEAYDISNIFGKYATGSMIVFTDGQIDKSEYRKFKIKTVEGIDDVGMLKEVLLRRLRHKEWPLPDLIFVDGGIPQFNGAKKILEEESLKIPVVALAKGPDRKGEKVFSSIPIKIDINFIKAIRDEAHRFAIWYHRKLRRRNLLA